ncbi:hypothetical protein DFA_08099 [Cavenderia fasciculata]|uniref:Uncharacterized protein n=1 Tax=Cavenderia fasciculata TaxID=261658 RepID=F4Q511_CACFS|nr:uncharacterized protein DFA_08099 [Cavenderia fasciculata]EGG17117.1 hypothetical protein DFA_08099 [Cavenderia fasciculata]|eukprot:XP_004355601.1 hypothetical protein DFA_08099 [Cavenderia fasciculata]
MLFKQLGSLNPPQTNSRAGIVEYLKAVIGRNMLSFTNKRDNKQDYSIPTVIGGIGIGKTRVGEETFISLVSNSEVSSCCKNFDKFWYVKFDFAASDKPLEGERASQFIGRCLVSRFFYGTSSAHAKTNIPEASVLEVVNLIDKLYVDQKGEKALLILHLDEYFMLPLPLLNELVSCLADLMLHPPTTISGQSTVIHNICVVPLMTGTDLDSANTSIYFSKLIPRDVRLIPLSDKDTSDLLATSANWNTLSKSLPYHSQVVVSYLGGVPRIIKAFLDACNGSTPLHDHIRWLGEVLRVTTNLISSNYNIHSWSQVFGASLVGLRTLLKIALSSYAVNRGYPLNGKTIRQVESTGLLMLIKVGVTPGCGNFDHPSSSDDQQKYTVHVPLALLRAINQELKDVDDSVLDPCLYSNSANFEVHMMPQIRVYRQNLLVSLSDTPVQVRDLYPHAIGFNSTLSLTVPIKHLQIVHDSETLATIPPTLVSILGSDPPRAVDITTGVFVINKRMASHADAIVYHSSDLVETIQYKSSDNTSQHFAPIADSQGVVKLADIISEWKKIEGSVTIPNCTVLFPFISNKPLAVNYQNKEQTLFARLEEYFSDPLNEGKPFHNYGRDYYIPSRIVLVVNENFSRYASCFATPSLYIPYKMKQ